MKGVRVRTRTHTYVWPRPNEVGTDGGLGAAAPNMSTYTSDDFVKGLQL